MRILGRPVERTAGPFPEMGLGLIWEAESLTPHHQMLCQVLLQHGGPRRR